MRSLLIKQITLGDSLSVQNLSVHVPITCILYFVIDTRGVSIQGGSRYVPITRPPPHLLTIGTKKLTVNVPIMRP